VPRADFYLIAKPRFRAQPLLLACELARKAHDGGQALLVLCESMAQAEQLDDLMWSFDPDAYLPHQIAGRDEDEDLVPILIAAPETDAPLRPLLLNLRAQAVQGAFERVLEVVPADEAARGPLRERWKAYQTRGFELKKFDM
jgi:DNA polymerase-3 subunit chi